MNQALILAVDPGREKCGLALVNPQGAIVRRAIVARSEAAAAVQRWAREASPSTIVIGGSTGSSQLRAELSRLLPQLPLETIDERNSTLEARALFWAANPPRGWRRLLPLSLQEPPVPLDDFAAVVLARRFLGV